MAPRSRAFLALGVVQLLFGCMPVVGKIALAGLGPETVVFFRISGAAFAFAFAFAVGPERRWPPLRAWPMIVLCSALGVVANQLLFMNGLARTSATHAALLTTSIPALTLLVSVLGGSEKLSTARVFGLGLAAAGAGLLIAERGGSGTPTVFGDLLIIGNATVYSLYLVLSRPLLAEHGALPVLAGLFVSGTLLAGPYTGLPNTDASHEAWLAMGFLVLGPTIGSYGLNLYAMRTLTPSTVALWIYLQPLVTALLAIPLLNEFPTPTFVLAAVFTFLGMYLAR